MTLEEQKEQEEFKQRLFKACLSRCNRPKAVKVEQCPYGFADGSIDGWIEQYTSGWSFDYGMIGIGAERRKKPRKIDIYNNAS